MSLQKGLNCNWVRVLASPVFLNFMTFWFLLRYGSTIESNLISTSIECLPALDGLIESHNASVVLARRGMAFVSPQANLVALDNSLRPYHFQTHAGEWGCVILILGYLQNNNNNNMRFVINSRWVLILCEGHVITCEYGLECLFRAGAMLHFFKKNLEWKIHFSCIWIPAESAALPPTQIFWR